MPLNSRIASTNLTTQALEFLNISIKFFPIQKNIMSFRNEQNVIMFIRMGKKKLIEIFRSSSACV
jgi:hypothetical protein